jgi:hypothetical protein
VDDLHGHSLEELVYVLAPVYPLAKGGARVLSRIFAKPPSAWAIAAKNDEPSAVRVESRATLLQSSYGRVADDTLTKCDIPPQEALL